MLCGSIRDGVGLTEIGSFQDHEGFDGVMLGVPGTSYHLEFTRQRDHTVGRASTHENLLVFYLPTRQEWQATIDRMVGAGYAPVAAYNPYCGIAQVARSKIRMGIVSYSRTRPGASTNKDLVLAICEECHHQNTPAVSLLV